MAKNVISCRKLNLFISTDKETSGGALGMTTKKAVLNLFLSISMAYNVISCQKAAENTQILKIAKFAM